MKKIDIENPDDFKALGWRDCSKCGWTHDPEYDCSKEKQIRCAQCLQPYDLNHASNGCPGNKLKTKN